MSKRLKIKRFDEKKYKEIVSEVGLSRYQIYMKGEQLPGSLFDRINYVQNFSHVVAGTGSTIGDFLITPIQQSGLVIPKDSQVAVVRFLRQDDSHGELHYNADDIAIFPDKKGDIYCFHRKDSPDHFISISENTHITSVADAYKLPLEPSGTIEQYKENGASLHIEVEELE